MANYTIHDLEVLTGIKAHTIRIWEKRYHIVKPSRTETNIRYYSDQDLKKLLNVSILNGQGLKISKIAQLDDKAIRDRLADTSRQDSSYQNQIDNLVVAMVELDQARFERTLADCTIRFGFEETCMQVLFPFMFKVGLMWQTDRVNPAQEHFVSNLVRQKLIVAIDGLFHTADAAGPKCILFLREGELHEIGLLFAHFVLKKNGYQTCYLGQSVPFNDLMEIVAVHSPDLLITAFIAPISAEELRMELTRLAKEFRGRILVSGPQVGKHNQAMPSNVFYVSDVYALLQCANGAQDAYPA